jgi:hypothetical protein
VPAQAENYHGFEPGANRRGLGLEQFQVNRHRLTTRKMRQTTENLSVI